MTYIIVFLLFHSLSPHSLSLLPHRPPPASFSHCWFLLRRSAVAVGLLLHTLHPPPSLLPPSLYAFTAPPPLPSLSSPPPALRPLPPSPGSMAAVTAMTEAGDPVHSGRERWRLGSSATPIRVRAARGGRIRREERPVAQRAATSLGGRLGGAVCGKGVLISFKQEWSYLLLISWDDS